MRSIADGWAAGRAAAMGLRACASASRKAPGTCARVPSTHFSWAKSAHQSIRACAGGCRRYITVSMHRTLLGLFLALSLSAADVNTFSIVAYDPATGDCGVTVASKYFSVGAVVPWAEAGTGCIATQANVNVGYGPRGLELLRQGLAARQVIDKLLADDTFPGKDGRQVAVIDDQGNVAAFTGPNAPNWAGDRQGKTWSAQGNILVGPQVPEAMGRAFEAIQGDLAERLFAALKAGDDAGGDSRGKQSASMLVVGNPTAGSRHAVAIGVVHDVVLDHDTGARAGFVVVGQRLILLPPGFRGR